MVKAGVFGIKFVNSFGEPFHKPSLMIVRKMALVYCEFTLYVPSVPLKPSSFSLQVLQSGIFQLL